ncbi:MAG: hypothetical protein E7471_02485 [Ruminococcaceae bacterium]|nr:hypothetical protein [Oscillospiraceae bacterium]
MPSEMELLARALLASTDGGKILENLDKFQKILDTAEGKKLLANLASGGGDALKKAAEQAKNGDKNAAKMLLTSLLQTKEGAALISQIIDAVKGS